MDYMIDQDLEEVLDKLMSEHRAKITQKVRVKTQYSIPKEALKYYNSDTGRCYKTGIPYCSPP
tara:strand:+ start:2666 stop:2854 length:189 start_codon:yes stop_codon:yes gene_type:complete